MRLPRRTRASPQSCSDRHGLRLCGIALEPFCAPVANGSCTSLTSVRWRWRTSSANASIDEPERGARVEQLGVGVAGQHLGGRHRPQPELLAHVLLDPWVDVGIGPDRARHLADGARLAGPLQPDAVAAELERPERELAAEGDRLGVDAVGAPDHGRVPVLPRPAHDRRLEVVDGADDEVAGPDEGHRHGGVGDVVGREPVVDPLGCRTADPLLHDVDEGRGLVVGHLLPGADRRHVEAGCVPERRVARSRMAAASASGTTPSLAQASVARISTSSQSENRASSVKSVAISGSE